MKDIEELRKAFNEYQAELLRNAPIEQRLAGLTPQQITDLLAQLPPELLEAAAKKRSS